MGGKGAAFAGVGLVKAGAPEWPVFKNGPRLFVILAPVTKLPNPFAPRAIAACLKVLAHQGLYRIVRQAVQRADGVKAVMIAQRHLNDFADNIWGRVWCAHGL